MKMFEEIREEEFRNLRSKTQFENELNTINTELLIINQQIDYLNFDFQFEEFSELDSIREKLLEDKTYIEIKISTINKQLEKLSNKRQKLSFINEYEYEE